MVHVFYRDRAKPQMFYGCTKQQPGTVSEDVALGLCEDAEEELRPQLEHHHSKALTPGWVSAAQLCPTACGVSSGPT